MKNKNDINEEIGEVLKQLALGSVSDPIRLLMHGNDLTERQLKRLNLLNVVDIKRTAGCISEIKFADRLKDAVNVLENGDGNDNKAEVIKIAGANIDYSDLISLWNSFDPYEMNTMIASSDMMAAILNMSQFRDAAAGLTFHGTGKALTPFGSRLLKSSALGEGKILGIDKNSALEMVKAGDITTEYDKLIDRQLVAGVRKTVKCKIHSKMLKYKAYSNFKTYGYKVYD